MEQIIDERFRTSWPIWGTKQMLEKQEQVDRSIDRNQYWPKWTYRILGEGNPESLIESVERKIERVLKISNVRQANKATGLRELAQYLDIEMSRGTERNFSYVYFWPDKRKWIARINHVNSRRRKESIAHEIAHATLYHQSPGRIHEMDWFGGTNSALEEGICEYIARLILLPEGLVRYNLRETEIKKRREELARIMEVTKMTADLRIREIFC